MKRLANALKSRRWGVYLPMVTDGSNRLNQVTTLMLMNIFRGPARMLLALLLSLSIVAPASLLVAQTAQAAEKSSARTTSKKVVKTRKHAAARVSHKASGSHRHRVARHKAAAAATVAAVAAAPLVLSSAEVAAEQRRKRPDSIQSTVSVPLDVESRAALITNARTGEVLYGKNIHQTMPIASITKLMTAMIVLDAGLDLNDPVTITDADVDHLRHTHSRLAVGTTLTRGDLMLIALMASENRAAAALARSYPGGTQAAVNAMNRKARSLGMTSAIFLDSTGLHGENSATPSDLVKMVQAAYRYPDIRAFSTMAEYQVPSKGQILQYKNTNGLVKKPEWNIEVSKTGYINEAGRCLVMMAHIRNIPVVIVLMDSWGKYTRIGDANRVKRWLELAYGT